MKQSVKLVNIGLEGEPEQMALQNPQTLEVFLFDVIEAININGNIRAFNSNEDWRLIIDKPNHIVEIEDGEAGCVLIV